MRNLVIVLLHICGDEKEIEKGWGSSTGVNGLSSKQNSVYVHSTVQYYVRVSSQRWGSQKSFPILPYNAVKP